MEGEINYNYSYNYNVCMYVCIYVHVNSLLARIPYDHGQLK